MAESKRGPQPGSVAGCQTMEAWLMSLPDQIRAALLVARERGWPRAGKPAKPGGAVLIGGMGGSAMAGRLAAAILAPDLRFPVIVQADSQLPAWVDAETPILLVSYSGHTWETVSMLEQARARGNDPWVVAGGGPLADGARAERYFPAELGMAPRAALGWTLTPVLLLLGAFAGRSMEQELLDTADLLEEEADLWAEGEHHPGRDPGALARFLHGRTIFVSSESEGERALATRWRCQLNENAKRFAGESAFPESVHNEIEGWADQAKLESPCLVILGGVERARDARGRVIDAAGRELSDLGFDLLRVPPYGDSRLERLLSQVFLGDRVSVDLARLSGVDPVPVGAIDRLKRAVATAPPKGGEEDR